MENTIVSGNRRTFRAALFGAAMLISGGTALAATAPAIAPLKFEYTAKDANGNTITLENKITTNYEADRVAVDASGNVYVTDAVSNIVNIFNTNGWLIRQININRAIAVGVDKDDNVYISGANENGRGIFVFDKENKEGNIGTGWSQPVGMAFAWGTARGSSDETLYDIYVADSMLNLVRRKTLNGTEVKDYGPYGGERYASEVIGGSTYSRTRHRMVFPQGVAVDETGGLLYMSVREVVETLGSAACSGDSGNCYADAENSWQAYNDGDTTDGSKTATDSTYQYWSPVTVSAGSKYHVLVIDLKTGELKSKISTGEGDFALQPRGLALDGKGRLYVATMNGGSVTGEIKVYDLATATALTTSGFSSGIYTDLAFSPDSTPDPDPAKAKGRLFATMGGSKTVSSYSIDGGINPANTAPTAPVLLEPVSLDDAVASVNTSTTTLRIRNSTDAENDPLTYAYEICSGSCTDANPNKVASAAEITGGADNETSMTVAQELDELLYHWRAQSFDGELTTWSDEATFCVDKENSNPTKPDVVAPKGEVVSSFASSLSWNASTDSDCSNNIVTYEVMVSDSQGNAVKSFSGVDVTSINVSDISGLVNGGTYNWTVRAADNKGGNSDYSSGSFTYMTTFVALGSDQAGTNVYIDGNYGYYGKLLGTVPVEKSDIVPGSHFVTFIKEGYEPHHAIIYVSDPAADLANSSVAYTAAMVAASKIKLSGSGTGLASISGGSATPFVVDYNDDGYKDIITGGKVNVYDESGQLADVIDGRVYLFIAQEQLQEDGTKKVVLIDNGAVQADGADINVGSKAVPFVVDYNNDSKKDILVGSGDGTVRLYKGTEGGFTDAGVLALKESDGNGLIVANAAPAVVDYNNDGKKDLVVGSSDGTLRLYSNTGSDESPVFDVPAAIKADGGDLNAGSNSRAFFTDWNSDGKKDLVVGRGIADSEGNTVSLFFNVGTDDLPEFKSISGLQQWIKEKKKERGNRDYIKYLGYSQDLGDLTGGSGEASPFVVDWGGTSARDIIVGNGSGGVVSYITE